MKKLSAIQSLPVETFLQIAQGIDSHQDLLMLNTALTPKRLEPKKQAQLPVMLAAYDESRRAQLQSIFAPQAHGAAFDVSRMQQSLMARSLGIGLAPPTLLCDPSQKPLAPGITHHGVGILAFANLSNTEISELLAHVAQASPFAGPPPRHSFARSRLPMQNTNQAGLHPLHTFTGALLHEALLRWCAQAPTLGEFSARRGAQATIQRVYADTLSRAHQGPRNPTVALSLSGELTTLPAALCLLSDLTILMVDSPQLQEIPEALAFLPELRQVFVNQNSQVLKDPAWLPIGDQGLGSSDAQIVDLMQKLRFASDETLRTGPYQATPLTFKRSTISQIDARLEDRTTQILHGAAATAEQALLQMRLRGNAERNSLQAEAAALALRPSMFDRFQGRLRDAEQGQQRGWRARYVEKLYDLGIYDLPYVDPFLGVVDPLESQRQSYSQRRGGVSSLYAIHAENVAAVETQMTPQTLQRRLTARFLLQTAGPLALLLGGAAYGMAGATAISALGSACVGLWLGAAIPVCTYIYLGFALRVHAARFLTPLHPLVPLPELGRNIVKQARSLSKKNYEHLPPFAARQYKTLQRVRLFFAVLAEAANTTMFLTYASLFVQGSTQFLMANCSAAAGVLVSNPVLLGVMSGILLLQGLRLTYEAINMHRPLIGDQFAAENVDIANEAALEKLLLTEAKAMRLGVRLG